MIQLTVNDTSGNGWFSVGGAEYPTTNLLAPKDNYCTVQSCQWVNGNIQDGGTLGCPLSDIGQSSCTDAQSGGEWYKGTLFVTWTPNPNNLEESYWYAFLQDQIINPENDVPCGFETNDPIDVPVVATEQLDGNYGIWTWANIGAFEAGL